jgi:hypothetical protein
MMAEARSADGRVNWTFDTNCRVISERVNDSDSITFGHDDDGLLTAQNRR